MPFLKNSFYFNRTDFFFLFIFHQRYIQDIDRIVLLIKVQTGNCFWTCSGSASVSQACVSEPAQYLVWYSWCHLLKSL